MSPLDFHFANHNAAIASASLPCPRKGSLPQARSELCHHALSNWYYSQAEQPGLEIYHHQHSISHDWLCELGLALRGSCGGWSHSSSQDTLLHHYSATIGANHSLEKLGRRGQTSSHSCSENLLSAYASYEQNCSCLLETLEKASVPILPHYKRPACPHQSNQPSRVEECQSLAHHEAVATVVPPLDWGLSKAQQPAAQIKCLPAQIVDDQMVSYCSYSTSFCQKASHLMQQSHSFSDTSNTLPILKTDPLQSASFTTTPTAVLQVSAAAGSVIGGFSEENIQVKSQEVVLQQKPPLGRKTTHGVLHPSYALPVDTLEPLLTTAVPSRSEDSLDQTNGGIPPLPVDQDSLAAIPFIGQWRFKLYSFFMLLDLGFVSVHYVMCLWFNGSYCGF